MAWIFVVLDRYVAGTHPGVDESSPGAYNLAGASRIYAFLIPHSIRSIQ